MAQINTAKKRYEVGLSKLANTETSVSAMQVRQWLQCAWPLLPNNTASAYLADGHSAGG